MHFFYILLFPHRKTSLNLELNEINGVVWFLSNFKWCQLLANNNETSKTRYVTVAVSIFIQIHFSLISTQIIFHRRTMGKCFEREPIVASRFDDAVLLSTNDLNPNTFFFKRVHETQMHLRRIDFEFCFCFVDAALVFVLLFVALCMRFTLHCLTAGKSLKPIYQFDVIVAHPIEKWQYVKCNNILEIFGYHFALQWICWFCFLLFTLRDKTNKIALHCIDNGKILSDPSFGIKHVDWWKKKKRIKLFTFFEEYCVFLYTYHRHKWNFDLVLTFCVIHNSQPFFQPEWVEIDLITMPCDNFSDSDHINTFFSIDIKAVFYKRI